MKSPSRIAADALALEVDEGEDLLPAESDGNCCLCGFPYCAGDFVILNPLKKVRQTFTNDADLANNLGVACKFCKSITARQPLQALMNSVSCKEGSFKILKDTHRAWFLMSPPEPPWVACVSDANVMSQHLVWFTPPTLDNNLMFIRHGRRLLQIRRKRLFVALDMCKEAAQIMLADSKNKRKVITHPYVFLDRNLTDYGHGQFTAHAMKLAATNQRMAEILYFLSANTLGETWALCTLAKKKHEVPVKPGRTILP